MAQRHAVATEILAATRLLCALSCARRKYDPYGGIELSPNVPSTGAVTAFCQGKPQSRHTGISGRFEGRAASSCDHMIR